MTIALRLLGDVRWRDSAVIGDRPQALLAALAAAAGRPVADDELIDLVWGEDPPLNGQKSLQVLVSRTRSTCGADVIRRDAVGYRLGAGPDEVDSTRLSEIVRDAGAALVTDPVVAAERARDALTLGQSLAGTPNGSAGPLAEVRRAAAEDVAFARVILAQASSRMGAHGDALPALETAHAERPRDESVLADLLRSEAVIRGPAAALERFERYRRDLRDRLGADPGEPLQRTHRDLLALDRPVRRGVRYEATALIGRDGDLSRLRALIAGTRVVSIVGPGGLGKTRLAQAIARDAALPAVYVCELAGVSAAEDVVGEIGSTVGLRDSIQDRRLLSAGQRADIRARVTQRLAQSPGLLVLDNCEHLIDAVAGLVAFLVSATSDLHVLTTSRAPLGIAAERVYQLGELDTDDALELFRERAVAARPSVRLAEPAVTSIVSRLDGLPLAIELAAVQVRAMSVEEIDQRLEDRFALLRGGYRSAPDRHQTLLAVIDWSWHLLDPSERRALRRLALFNDGFTLAAADAVLGGDAIAGVQGLVGQSLLSVREDSAGVRYWMLETVREFGRMKLADAGEEREARAALRGWAVDLARANRARLTGTSQFAAIDAVAAEESNLADELRAAIAEADGGAVVELLATLGLFWTVRGEHGRLLVMADPVADVLAGWQPPPDLAEVTSAAVAIVLGNTMIAGGDRVGRLQAQLQHLVASTGADVPLARLVTTMMAFDPTDIEAARHGLEALAADCDRRTAVAASQWLSNVRENEGDPAGAIDAAERALALVEDHDGPWARAMPHATLAGLTLHMGNRAAAREHVRAALPVLQRLGATDDEILLRSVLVYCAIAEGRLADAEAELDRIDTAAGSGTVFGGTAFRQVCRAELLLAGGDHAAGLAVYRECAAFMRDLAFPGIRRTGQEPWALFGSAVALTAHAYYATAAEEKYGHALFRACRRDALGALEASGLDLDFPVAGLLLFGLGTWGLLHGAAPASDATRLLVLADRFAYTRSIPTMAWGRIAPAAEEAAPGLIAELQSRYAGRRPADLLAEARRAIEELPG